MFGLACNGKEPNARWGPAKRPANPGQSNAKRSTPSKWLTVTPMRKKRIGVGEGVLVSDCLRIKFGHSHANSSMFNSTSPGCLLDSMLSKVKIIVIVPGSRKMSKLFSGFCFLVLFRFFLKKQKVYCGPVAFCEIPLFRFFLRRCFLRTAGYLEANYFNVALFDLLI